MVTSKSSSIHVPDREYLQALRLYWQNEKDGALSLISEELAKDKTTTPHCYYRLWIEVLAEGHDEASLRILQEHIRGVIDFSHPSWVGLFALTGLIHYELGELEACAIVLRKLTPRCSDPYCQELTLVLAHSLSDDEKSGLAKKIIKNSSDYLTIRRVILVGLNLQSTFAKKAIASLDEWIGMNPLSAEIGFHQSFSARDFRKACQFAQILRDAFPLNGNYQFYLAYCSYLMSNNRTALEEFLKLNRRLNQEDPDVLCMIGATLMQSKQNPMSQKLRSRIEYYLESARLRLKSQGLPTHYTQDLLLRLHTHSDIPSSGRYWIVKLSAKQCYDLYQKPENRIQHLHRAMGPYVKTGDTCLFVSESQVADSEHIGIWRLTAIYKAISDPEWHPTHRWQTILKLQLRMEVTVPLEIEGNQKEAIRGDGPHRYGLHEIDDSAMIWIEDAVRDFTLDDQSVVQIFTELKFARSV